MAQSAPGNLVRFDVGEKVAMIEGQFKGFAGAVEGVEDENQRLKVPVSIFGRATPVMPEYTQMTKQV